MRALAFIFGGFAALVLVASVIGGMTEQHSEPTPDQVRADCATAPNPDQCFDDAEARILAPRLDALAHQQQAAEDKAAGG